MTTTTVFVLFLALVLLVPVLAEAECSWALIEHAGRPDPESSVWHRLWYRWTHGGEWVVNHFFPSFEACRALDEQRTAEAHRIAASKTRDIREIQRGTDLLNSRCVPVEALSLFTVRPGAAFPKP